MTPRVGPSDPFRSKLSVRNVLAKFRCSTATLWVPFGADGRRRLWLAGGWVARLTFSAWKGDSALDSGCIRFAEQCFENAGTCTKLSSQGAYPWHKPLVQMCLSGHDRQRGRKNNMCAGACKLMLADQKFVDPFA